jgi:hypothetical protein
LNIGGGVSRKEMRPSLQIEALQPTHTLRERSVMVHWRLRYHGYLFWRSRDNRFLRT